MFNIGAMDVDITNVHAAGGIRMMQEARLGLAEGAESQGYQPPKLIAVTQLTSTDQEMLETELLIKEPIADVVKKYAENAKKAGLDGVVCSPLEAPIMTLLDLISVTPGIRLLGDSVNDQKRVSTPEGAKKMGSTYIVVGRSITAAEDPLAAYERCVAEFCD
jgi:orotidine-5'-phosphate decarboxylase